MVDLSHMTENGLSEIPKSELEMRKAKVDKVLSEKGLEGMIFFSDTSVYYLTGSSLSQSERPMVYIHRLGAEGSFLVPQLEAEHVYEYAQGCIIAHYPEYPGIKHPMLFLADLIKEMGLEKASLGADMEGSPGIKGYRGPKLGEVCPDLKLTLMPRMIEEFMMVKSPFEQSLIRESARWGHLTHMLLQEYTKPGLREFELCDRASSEATRIMLKVLAPRFKLSGYDSRGATIVFRGQVGAHSYFPHAVATNTPFKMGDMLVTGASAKILGYGSELERCMFLGEPSKEHRHYYGLVTEARNTAFTNIKPGKKCSDVDKEVMRFFEEHDLMKHWRHHTGHSLGFLGHEAPFFDVGDDTTLVPGMVFSVEPGIYVEGLGGFRPSDTVLVTETGCELITYYTRNIDELICG